jgi:hypothetical protein
LVIRFSLAIDSSDLRFLAVRNILIFFSGSIFLNRDFFRGFFFELGEEAYPPSAILTEGIFFRRFFPPVKFLSYRFQSCIFHLKFY